MTNNRHIAIGMRRKRIRLQRPRTLRQSGGRTVKVIEDIATVWAAVKSRSAGAELEADQRFLTRDIQFETHYAKRFLATRHIIADGTSYDVEAVEDVDLAHKTLIFRAKPQAVSAAPEG